MKYLLILFFAVCTCCGPVSCAVWDKFYHAAQKHEHAAIEETTQQFSINGPSGQIVAILETPAIPEDKQCPVVLLMHGLTSQKNDPINVRVATLLRERGIASIRFDFNGHGESGGQFKDMTISLEKQDAHTIYDFVRSQKYVSDIGILGHSQGALVCALMAAEMKSKIAAAVLMSTAAVIPITAKTGSILGVSFDRDNIPEDGITLWRHNIGKNYILDAQNMDPFNASKGYEGPVCIMHGAKDTAVPLDIVDRIKELYHDPEVYIYQDDNHGFARNFDNVCITAADFLAKHLATENNLK